MLRSEALISSSTPPNSTSVTPHSSRQRRTGPNAATPTSLTRPFCRPMKAAISISCDAKDPAERHPTKEGTRLRRSQPATHSFKDAYANGTHARDKTTTEVELTFKTPMG